MSVLLPPQTMYTGPPPSLVRVMFYSFGVIDGVAIPPHNISFQIKGGFFCTWDTVPMVSLQGQESTVRATHELGFWDAPIEVGRTSASEDGAWCLPEIQATLNGVPLGGSVQLSSLLSTNRTAYVMITGGIGRAPLSTIAFSLDDTCADAGDPESDHSGVVIFWLMAWATAIVVVTFSVVFV